MTDEKFLDQKMDRREFLKKAGIGGAGLALGLSGASAFFTNQDSSRINCKNKCNIYSNSSSRASQAVL